MPLHLSWAQPPGDTLAESSHTRSHKQDQQKNCPANPSQECGMVSKKKKKNSGFVTECQLMWLTHSEAKQTKMSEFGAEKGLLQGHGRRVVGDSGEGWVTRDPLNPQLFEGVSAKHFKGKVKEQHGWLLRTSWCQNPLFLQLSLEFNSGWSCKLPTRQMFFSVLRFFNIYMNAKVTLKGQSLENGLSCTFQAVGNILNIKQEQ